MTKTMLSIAVLCLALTSCNKAHSEAQRIVASELGGPELIQFRNLRTDDSGKLVCGEVMASDRPGGGWRYFVAYTQLGRAAVSPPGGITRDAEMGDAVLSGEADRFHHMCD